MANARLLGLGSDYVRLYRERLAAVTTLQARAAAARTFRRNGLSIIVVGDGEKLYDRLKTIAPVRMVDVDGKTLTAADLHPQADAPKLDRAQVVTRADSFEVLIQGNAMGGMTGSTTVTGDSVTYVERTSIAGGMMQQNTTVRFNPADLTVTRVDQTGSTQGQATDIHLTYGGGRVTGKSTTPQQNGPPQTIQIDTAIAAGTYDDNALAVVFPALPLAAGQSFNLSVFESGKGQVKVIQVKVSDGGTVIVPAGSFDSFKVDVTGGQVPTTFYVSKSTPRRIVKIELVGAPFIFQLVK